MASQPLARSVALNIGSCCGEDYAAIVAAEDIQRVVEDLPSS